MKKKRIIKILLISVILLVTVLTSLIFLRNVQKKENLRNLALQTEESQRLEAETKRNELKIDEFTNTQNELEEEDKGNPNNQPIADSEQTPTVQPEQPVAADPPPPKPTSWWDYPSVIEEIPIEQVTLSVIMNKSRKLSSHYIPSDLVQLQSMPGIRVSKTLYVRSIIIESLMQLGTAAQAEGVDLTIISAYRSYVTQQGTYQYWINYNGGNVNVADQVSARPGHSEHQLGTTVDFSTSEINDAIGSQFNSTKASNWLLNNATKFGFKLSYPANQEQVTGFAHEGWHWRYNP